MTARLFVLVAFIAAGGAPTHSQTAPAPDGVALLTSRLEQGLQGNDWSKVSALFSSLLTPQQIERFQDDFVVPLAVRVAVRERDRAPLQGSLPGDGYRLTLEMFAETARRGRIMTVRLDVRRPRDGSADSWRITGAERLSLVEGLHRLRLDTNTQLAAKNVAIRSDDVTLMLSSGTVFRVDSEEGTTGLVLIGQGELRFSPAPPTEKAQLRIFAGTDTLATPFDAAFVRLNPADYARRIGDGDLRSEPVDPQRLRRAQDVFAREAPKSLNLDLRDLSRETWYLLPPSGDFLAEVRTRRFGTLTYGRTRAQPEDITMFDRAKRRTIALYPSSERLAARGPFYSEDDLIDFDVVDYDIEATLTPQREFLSARTRLLLRARSDLASLTLHLAETLVIKDMVSPEFGRLLYLRVRNQNSVIVTLPATLPRDAEMSLVVEYAGTVASQRIDVEAAQAAFQDEAPPLATEPHWLLSNRSYWYPQGDASDYAAATLRLTVPEGYGCIASGEPADAPAPAREPATGGRLRQFVFTATDPVRYLAAIVGKFSPVGRRIVRFGPGGSADEPAAAPVLSSSGERLPGFRLRDRVALGVQASARLQGPGRERLEWAEDIMRFYSGVMGDAPYASLNVALVEQELPGGHSPAYAALLNSPSPLATRAWRNDPAAFAGFEEFFLAHELAHQWWGQAVGWKNYHEQWLSEAFAQYFSALYAQKAHGDNTFIAMLRQFRQWAVSESDAGPIYLGYRLGHIKGESRVFRALVYNKGAAVLHMLRRLIGDEMFFNGLRRFYNEQRFQKAGTDDLRRAFEAETGRSLDRFFEQWIYGSDLPRLRYRISYAADAVRVRFEQPEQHVFDVPVTVTLSYGNGTSEDVVVVVNAKVTEQTLRSRGAVRQVQVNRDSAALAIFDES